MSTVAEARILLANDTEATYVGEAADMPRLPEWPFLAIHVADFEEALEVVATLERSKRRRAASKEESKDLTTPAPAAATGTIPRAGETAGRGQEVSKRGSMPEDCIAPGCAIGPILGEDVCVDHALAPDDIKAEWRRAREQGKRRAKGAESGAEPGAVA